MRTYTVVFNEEARKPITVEADDVNMGAAGQIPCLIFFNVSNLIAAGAAPSPQGKIIHIVPLQNVLSCTSTEHVTSKLSIVQ